MCHWNWTCNITSPLPRRCGDTGLFQQVLRSAAVVTAVLLVPCGQAHAGEPPECPDPPGGGPGYQCPAGCSGHVAIVDMNLSESVAIPGQIVCFTVQAMNAGPLPTRCGLSGGQLVFTLPDGSVVELAGFGGSTPDVPLLLPIGLIIPPSFFPSDPGFEIPYTVPTDAMSGVTVVRADWGCSSLYPDNECIYVHSQSGLSAYAATSNELSIRVPCINLEMTTDSAQVCEDDPTVSYTYYVETCGLDPLTNIDLSDTGCADIAGPFGVGIDGSCDGIAPTSGALPAGETWCYECSTSLTQTSTSIAELSANAIGTDGIVVTEIDYTDSAEATVAVEESVIEILCGQLDNGSIQLCANANGSDEFEWSTGESTQCILISDPVCTEYCAGTSSENGCPTGGCALLEPSEAGCACPADAPALCQGDLNFNSSVDVTDLLMMLGAWGTCPGCPADMNYDGTVNVLDLLTLLGTWGVCP